jgi:hypothetical protein
MRFLFRLIPVAAGLITLVPFAWLATTAHGWQLVMAGTAVFLWYALFELFGRRVREPDIWWATALTLFLVVSSIGFFLLVEGWIPRIVQALITAGIVAVFFEQLYRWFYAMKVPSYALGVMIALVEVVTMFFLAADVVGLRIFVGVPAWLLTLGFMVAAIVLFLIARSAQGKRPVPVLAALLLGVLFGELLWAVLVLPTGFMVGGAIIAIVWYTVAGLFRMADWGIGLGTSAPRYLTLAALLLLLVAFSARWT